MLQDVPSPSSPSLNFRSKLATLISPLKRVRPRVPFFRLAAHRIPTLWGLYKGLLRTAPTENIHQHIRIWFRKNHHITGTDRTIRELQKGYKWLETFERAQSGDTKTQALLQRYDRFLQLKAEKAEWKMLARKEMEWIQRMKNRPIVTGGLIHPTLYNPPLPRLRPQPMAISRIIAKRIKQRTRRFMRMEDLAQMKDMVRREQDMERELLEAGVPFEPMYFGSDKQDSWLQPINEASRDIYESVKRSAERNLRPFPESLLNLVREARRNKIANKTKERERERRGEILNRTRKRWRKNLTPHLLSTLSKEKIREELIVQRSVAEVGYVGLLKKRKGWKLREPKEKVEGKEWSVEDAEWIGKEDREAAKKVLLVIQEENARRRANKEPEE
ncbi:hypothetical protein BDP27DRAFT_1290070 [Rhodocollybia butyracea]|uniref:Uncharacterized protein n=1 Tax=Rhodocollybia butyracea TaxID=206335 RepID=A0A9P5PUN2_9AGAR|nr:hypothetical protein BDP27DRAFT_1290070 [Rhodocollybia butyracea]